MLDVRTARDTFKVQQAGPIMRRLVNRQGKARLMDQRLTNPSPGGRTAWSSTVLINGQEYSARYWYAGDHANNAREDAAEVALQRMGIVPTPRSPYAQQSPATR